MFNAARQLGSVLGVAVFGTLTTGGLVPGLHGAAVAGATGFLAAALLAARRVPGAGPRPDPVA
ncbi:hypothetical protein ACWEQ8_16865 [Streptomyces noursei]